MCTQANGINLPHTLAGECVFAIYILRLLRKSAKIHFSFVVARVAFGSVLNSGVACQVDDVHSLPKALLFSLLRISLARYDFDVSVCVWPNIYRLRLVSASHFSAN